MEYWKIGIMGFGEIHLHIGTKKSINLEYSFLKQHSNIPSFHYSMYEAKSQVSKNTIKFIKL